MKFFIFTGLVAIGLSGGCMSATRVQEMIDASQADQSRALQAHGKSIGILQESAAKALEQNEQQAAEIDALEKQLEAVLAQIKPIQGNAEAAKVMSAANTVRVAELADAMAANRETIEETIEKMETYDTLFEEVMIAHLKQLIASANEAIATLQADDVAATNGTTTGLAAPIEIVAPDTSAPTNTANGGDETDTQPSAE